MTTRTAHTRRKKDCERDYQQQDKSTLHTEITMFTKSEGPLTKRISLLEDGSVKSDGGACLMAKGVAGRVAIANVQQLATLIEQLQSNQAIALGALRTGLPDRVKIVTKAKLLSGVALPNVIARTADDIRYGEGQPAFALIDTDSKGMPIDIAARIRQLGGVWPALLSVSPALRDVARVTRRSTSAGLSRFDTGEKLSGSENLHIYLAAQDGADIGRFLRAFHVRCWLAGFGWMMVGKSGVLLERSLVDRMVSGPERLVFEGPPILIKPIQQDRESRRPVAVDGELLDTSALFPPLTIVETAKYEELRAKEEQRLAPEVAKVRAAYVEDKAQELIKHKPGMTLPAARRIIERQCDDGVLLPDVVLPFDDQEFVGCTVADVLADPDRFADATLADPNEGPDYGRCVAKILHRPDGTLFIHSFAHGRTFYHLKFDASAVRAAIEKVEEKMAAKTLVDFFATADLDAQEREELRDLAHKRSKINKRTIDTMLKKAQQEHAAKCANQERARRAAERSDARPQIENPAVDAPWLPQMQALNDVLGASPVTKPPARNIDDDVTRSRKLRVPNTHAFTQGDANAEPEEE